MKKRCILLLSLLGLLSSQAQNLVPNPSFEVYSQLPSSIMTNADLEYATPWFDRPSYVGAGSGTSPDYIHINMPLSLYNGDVYEFQNPHSGYAMAGFHSCNYNEAVQIGESFEVRLEEALQVGQSYRVSFYVKLANYYNIGACTYGSDELGVYFHTDTIYSITYFEDHGDSVKIDNAIRLFELDTTEWGNEFYSFVEYLQVPDVALDTIVNDTENWLLVSDTLYADEAYEFMTFGRFNLFQDIAWAINPCGYSTASSTFMVDDVSVHLLEEPHLPAFAGADSSLCLGASVQLGSTALEDYMYWWSPNQDMEVNLYGGTNQGMPWVSPTETTTYTLVQKDFAFIESTDQVTITVENCIGLEEQSHKAINVYPNPVENQWHIDLLSPQSEPVYLQVYSLMGREVLRQELQGISSSVNTAPIAAGTYLYKIYSSSKLLKQGKFVKK